MFTIIRKMKERDERGFTLVELLIVIAIIAILAAIAIPQFASYRQRGIKASMQADGRNIATAEEAFFSDNQSYTTVSAFTAATTIGTQSVKPSQGNSIAIGATTNTYTITVSNGSLPTGSQTYTLTNAGVTGWQ